MYIDYIINIRVLKNSRFNVLYFLNDLFILKKQQCCASIIISNRLGNTTFLFSNAEEFAFWCSLILFILRMPLCFFSIKIIIFINKNKNLFFQMLKNSHLDVSPIHKLEKFLRAGLCLELSVLSITSIFSF